VNELEQVTLERDRLRIVVDELAKRGRSTFRVAITDKALIVTGPTGTEMEMAKACMGIHNAAVAIQADDGRHTALMELVTLRYLYGDRVSGRSARGCLHSAIEALGGEHIANMPPNEAYALLNGGEG